jgi:hypothetical protein
MRSFYVACAILIIIISLIIFNSFYVFNKVDELLILCQRLEENEFGGSLKPLNDLINNWDECRNKLALSISHNEIDRAESALYLLASYYALGEQVDFLAQLENFKSALRHILNYQEFSFHNIF